MSESQDESNRMLKKPASATDRGAEARDIRERRDVDRLDSHLVSPIPPISLGDPAKVFFCCATRADHRSSSAPK